MCDEPSMLDVPTHPRIAHDISGTKEKNPFLKK
jgi:hypothetical protein